MGQEHTLSLGEPGNDSRRLIDAWEIAKRNNIFIAVGMKRLPFLANSDFHKPKHIYSWKTLLRCEKNAEAIKECIRKNEHVSITLYRDNNRLATHVEARDATDDIPRTIQFAELPFKAARSR